MSVTAVPDDLTHRVANAAWSAVLNKRDALEAAAGQIRGMTIEITVDGRGCVHEAVTFLERRSKGTALLGRYQRGAQ
jgi:hypothetical protein